MLWNRGVLQTELKGKFTDSTIVNAMAHLRRLPLFCLTIPVDVSFSCCLFGLVSECTSKSNNADEFHFELVTQTNQKLNSNAWRVHPL